MCLYYEQIFLKKSLNYTFFYLKPALCEEYSRTNTRTNFAFHIFSFRVFWAFFCLFVKSHSLWWWQDQRNIIWIQNWYQSQQKKHFLFQIAELYSIRCDRLSTYPPDCHCCHNIIQYSQCSKKLEKSAQSH